MITPHLQEQCNHTKEAIDNSRLPDSEKKRWHTLLDTALENCNGLTQKQKIEGIAQLLFEQTVILLNRRIRELDFEDVLEKDERSIEILSNQTGEIQKVQNTQQKVIEGMDRNMEKIEEVSAAVNLINDKMKQTETRDAADREHVEKTIEAIFKKTSDDIVELRGELTKYTISLSEYDKKQDEFSRNEYEKIDKRFDSLEEKLIKIMEPATWKGVVTRLFTPTSAIIVILIIVMVVLLRPELLSVIGGFFHH